MQLSRLPDETSEQLLTRRIGPARAEAEPRAVQQIVESCAGLPLALAIVAARAARNPRLSIAALATQLRTPSGTLDLLSGSDAGLDIRRVFSWSYDALTQPAGQLFRMLSVHPGPDISIGAATSVSGSSERITRRLVDELSGTNLLTENEPGRYQLHDLLRAYAADLLDQEREREAACARLIQHYVHSTRAAYLVHGRPPVSHLDPPPPGVSPEPVDTMAGSTNWYKRERAVLEAVVDIALGTDDVAAACNIVLDWRPMNQWLGVTKDTLSVVSRVVAAAHGRVETASEVELLRDVALLQARVGDIALAKVQLEHGLSLLEEVGDLAGQAHIHRNLGRVAEIAGDLDAVLVHAGHAVRLGRLSGQPGALVPALIYHASALLDAGRLDDGVAVGEQALIEAEAGQVEYVINDALQSLAIAHLGLGHWHRAQELLEMVRSPTPPDGLGPAHAS
jgi:hypothetical protein